MGEAAGIAAELDLVEQLSAANAAFRPAAREIIEEIAGRAGLWHRGASVRRRAEFEPFSDTARTEPGFSGDVADRVSGIAQSPDLIKDGLPRAAMRLLDKVSMLREFGHPDHVRSSLRLRLWIPATRLGPLIGRRGSPGSRSSRASLQEMEAVSDPPRLRRALSRALRIQTAAIAADDFDLRMLAKPFGCSGGCAIRQHIDNLAPLQVNDNGPVSATLSPAPVVDACHSYSRLGAELKDLKLDDDTILMFASDNGPRRDIPGDGQQGTPDMGNAGPFRGELGEATEGAIRTFAYIRWPGHIKPDTSSYAMFSIMDFMPTLASIVGGKMPTDRPIDGVDQSDVLFGKSTVGHRENLLTFIGPHSSTLT